VNLARALAQFGFYNFEELLKLARNLLAITDSNPKSIEAPSSHKCKQKYIKPKFINVLDHLAPHNHFIKKLTRGMLQTIEGIGDQAVVTQPVRPKTLKRNESESSYDSALAKESRELILQTKLIVVELLQVNFLDSHAF
jgi:hypothetical protein